MDLDEVELFRAQDVLHLVQAAVDVMSDTDIAGLALGLELMGVRELLLPVAHVVHLQQVDLVGVQRLQGTGPLRLG
ncbi:hypothetical protein D3C81_1738080 [compost metagenome]